MQVLEKIFTYIAMFSIIGAFIIPDYIAGVNKAMRLGKVEYPKEKRKKKWKWIGIFLAVGIASALLSYLCSMA